MTATQPETTRKDELLSLVVIFSSISDPSFCEPRMNVAFIDGKRRVHHRIHKTHRNCCLPNLFSCQKSMSDLVASALGRPEHLCSRFRLRHRRRLNLKQLALHVPYRESGGAERDRTVDPLLAKQVLSQLSYSPYRLQGLRGKPLRPLALLARLRRPLRNSPARRISGATDKWWAWVDSNYRPHPYQGCALTN